MTLSEASIGKSLRGKNEDRSIFGGVDNAIRRAAGNAPNGTYRPDLVTLTYLAARNDGQVITGTY